MNNKWNAIWGNAMSIVTHQVEQYAKDITLRYPMVCAFDGDAIKLNFDNFTGKEKVVLHHVRIAKVSQQQDVIKDSIKTVTFNGNDFVELEAGEEKESDTISFYVKKNEKIAVSFYLKDFTHMRCGVLTQGPLSTAYFAEGNHSEADVFPRHLSMKTSWVYFLNEVDLRCDSAHKVVTCYGDSITSQDWPDYLQQQMIANDQEVSIVRRAVSGTRILREYDCVLYEAYGLKGTKRFPHEMNVAGSDTLIILQGINDIIHPVGKEKNEFRPWSDLPSVEELIDGLRYYVKYAKEKGMKVYIGTLIPIEGWRTFEPFREDLRNGVNEWIRTTKEIEGCIDFDKAIRDENYISRMKEIYDSGDHLHPSDLGYEAMATCAYHALVGND